LHVLPEERANPEGTKEKHKQPAIMFRCNTVNDEIHESIAFWYSIALQVRCTETAHPSIPLTNISEGDSELGERFREVPESRSVTWF
jgi:hypothetical protein